MICPTCKACRRIGNTSSRSSSRPRNQHLLADLSQELKKIPPTGSIVVFYGAGHMDDMEKRVTGDLHYRPADEIWLSAFSVDLRQSGISPDEAQWMRTLIQGEMDQMQKH